MNHKDVIIPALTNSQNAVVSQCSMQSHLDSLISAATAPSPSTSPNLQQHQSNNNSFVIPWHSIVPILSTASETISPPALQMSPPLSAPALISSAPSQVPASVLDLHDDEDNVEPMVINNEDDDEVFESEPSDVPGQDISVGNKRRSQSLSSLPNNAKDGAITKVNMKLVFFL